MSLCCLVLLRVLCFVFLFCAFVSLGPCVSCSCVPLVLLCYFVLCFVLLSFVSLVSLVFLSLLCSCVCVFPLVKLRPLHTKNYFYLSPLYKLTDFLIFSMPKARLACVGPNFLSFLLHADSKTFKHRPGPFSEGRQ